MSVSVCAGVRQVLECLATDVAAAAAAAARAAASAVRRGRLAQLKAVSSIAHIHTHT